MLLIRQSELRQCPNGPPEYLIPEFEPVHVFTNLRHSPRDVDSQCRVLRSAEPTFEADEVRLAPSGVTVVGVDRTCDDLNQDLIVAHWGRLGLNESQGFRRSITGANDGFHDVGPFDCLQCKLIQSVYVYNVNMSSVNQKSSTAQPVRVPLSRDRILQVAVEIMDTEGLGSLTMRRLGHDLDVEAMALYRHVRGKVDILDGMVDLVLGEIDLSPPSEDWKTSLRASAISAHETLLRHPWTCGLVLTPNLRAIPNRMIYIESILARLRAAGFS